MRKDRKVIIEEFPQLRIFGVAPGCIKGNKRKTDDLLKSSASHLVTGTFTPAPMNYHMEVPGHKPFWRCGENLMTLYEINNGNSGLPEMMEYISETQIRAKRCNKTFVVTVSDFYTGDDKAAAKSISGLCSKLKDVDIICIDLSLSGQMIHGYSPQLLKALLEELKPYGKKFWVTLPNYNIWQPSEFTERMEHMRDTISANGYDLKFHESSFTTSSIAILMAIAEVIIKSGIVTAVAGPGPIPGIELRELGSNKSVISYGSKQTVGNLTGPITTLISMPQVLTFAQIFPKDIDILPIGGPVETAAGLKQVLECGAAGGLVHGRFLQHGTYGIESPLAELLEFA